VPDRRRAGRTGLTLACLAVMAVGLAQDGGETTQAFDELDTVLIVGERTPPLWKLTRKGHVLWILGTFSPQPRNMQLNTQRLDQLIAGSREVILPGAAYVASPGISAMTHVVKSHRNPDGATLQDLLPADAYAKWVALREKYSLSPGVSQGAPKFAWGANNAKWVVLTEPYRGGDAIDAMRPTLAWEALRRAAMDRHGLVNYDISAGVEAIAKRHSVPVRRQRQGREVILVWNADPVVERIDVKKADVAEVVDRVDYGDLGCLMANLDLLEPVIEMRKVQASAWARGDLEGMNKADTGIRLRDCVTELVAAVSGGRLPGSVDSKKAQDRYHRANRDSNKEVQKHWMNAVLDAVKKNPVTFSVLPIEKVLDRDGYLDALRDRGFVIEQEEGSTGATTAAPEVQ
jgi:hypothetical protein